MRIYIDNQLIKEAKVRQSFLQENIQAADQLQFLWPSFLQYLNLADLFKGFPKFDESNSLYRDYIAHLLQKQDQSFVFNMYDHLFAECLTQVKAFSEMNAPFLMEALLKADEKNTSSYLKKLFSYSTERYKKSFSDNPVFAMHDLIFYLGWDRMCVCVGNLFDYQTTEPHFLTNIKIFKDCLIESFQHITKTGHTAPSFFKLVEALFFYQMREEHLQNHSEEEWQILNKSFHAFHSKDKLADYYYIDTRLVENNKLDLKPKFLNLDSKDYVSTRIALAQLMNKKLKEENPSWNFDLLDTEIIFG